MKFTNIILFIITITLLTTVFSKIRRQNISCCNSINLDAVRNDYLNSKSFKVKKYSSAGVKVFKIANGRNAS